AASRISPLSLHDALPILRDGKAAVGTMVFEFATTGIARLAAAAGAEFVIFDMEHTGWSIETIRMLLATSVGADIAPMVRVPATRSEEHTSELQSRSDLVC